MAEIRWIKTSSFLMLLLHFTAAVTGQHSLSFVVRVGGEVSLICENVIDGQDKCDGTTWLFIGTGSTAPVQLIELGKIGEKAKAKSDRLSVTASCSLVIKKATVEDVGYYNCKQLESGHQQFEETQVVLSVINMTEHEDPDKVTLTCSVSTYGQCGHTVKWQYEGKDVDKDNKDMKTSQSDCTVTVTFLTSSLKQKSKYHELLKCEVTDGYTNKVQLFPFSPQPSGAATTRSISTAAPPPPPTTQEDWWRFSIVSVGLAALIIIVVAVNMWTRTKGKKTQMDENKVYDDEDEDDGEL
ncbi:uncharacterized protein LOC122863070 isoform X2 [Siniperca chuatsi]|uniref:uncharacterized protein LOC122863070 isoform X2 n=1 Tax=Siniperca chuatsi TaxID=119488 RepID=UPI001CE087FE|nr:uncharacterized protein LOC122863070 isoform X2 [Siniperca chuatsi]